MRNKTLLFSAVLAFMNVNMSYKCGWNAFCLLCSAWHTLFWFFLDGNISLMSMCLQKQIWSYSDQKHQLHLHKKCIRHRLKKGTNDLNIKQSLDALFQPGRSCNDILRRSVFSMWVGPEGIFNIFWEVWDDWLP